MDRLGEFLLLAGASVPEIPRKPLKSESLSAFTALVCYWKILLTHLASGSQHTWVRILFGTWFPTRFCVPRPPLEFKVNALKIVKLTHLGKKILLRFLMKPKSSFENLNRTSIPLPKDTKMQLMKGLTRLSFSAVTCHSPSLGPRAHQIYYFMAPKICCRTRTKYQ